MIRSCLVAFVVLLAACGDRGTARVTVDERSSYDVPGTPLEIAVADDVGVFLDGKAVARGPREVGTTLAAPMDGRDCTIAVVGASMIAETDDNPATRKPTTRDIRTDQFRAAALELRCADGPAPGSAGTLRGGQPRKALVWIAPGLALGFLAGLLLWRRSKAYQASLGLELGAVAGAIVALAAAGGLAAVMFASWFKLSLGALAVAFAGVGLLAGFQWTKYRLASVLGVVAALVGAAAFSVRLKAWTFAAPLAALGVAAGAWVIAMIVASSLTPAGKVK